MPLSAIQNLQVDYVLEVAGIADLIRRLTGGPVSQEAPMQEVRPTPQESEASGMKNQDGRSDDGVTGFTCPECGGALWEEPAQPKPRYRCRVGHAYAEGTLEAKHAEVVEAALWTAVRYLDEKAALSQRIADRLRARNQVNAAQRFELNAEEAKRRATVIREMLIKEIPEPPPDSKGVPPESEGN
jgi:two-component system chemotaxis response regulator CheB